MSSQTLTLTASASPSASASASAPPTYRAELRDPNAWFQRWTPVSILATGGTLHVGAHALSRPKLHVSRGLGRDEYVLTTARAILTVRPSPAHKSDWPCVLSLLRAPAAYALLHPLGAGAFGAVHRARRRADGALVAVKRVPKRALRGSRHAYAAARMEGLVGRLLPPHPNVVRTLEARESPTHFVTVMELVEGHTLLDCVRRDKIPQPVVARVMRQLLAAVAHLHANGFVHRDVKLENVLVADAATERPLVKLCDLGLVVSEERLRHADVQESRAGTEYALAPEVVFRGEGEYDRQIDVWACGVVMFALLYRRIPWSDCENERQTQMGKMRMVTRDRRPSVEALITEEESARKDRSETSLLLHSLLAGLLHPDPKRRLTARAALEHPLFEEYDKSTPDVDVVRNDFRKQPRPLLLRKSKSFRRWAMILIATMRTIGNLQSSRSGHGSHNIVVL